MAVEAQVALSDRLRGYLEAWNALDPVTVKNLYREDGTHRGPGVVMVHPELAGSTLYGNDAIYDFAVACAAMAVESDMVVTWALEDASTSVVEYDIRFERGGEMKSEIIQWDRAKSARSTRTSWQQRANGQANPSGPARRTWYRQ
jgi:hypothetical protein